jgi:hypothetical protein
MLLARRADIGQLARALPARLVHLDRHGLAGHAAGDDLPRTRRGIDPLTDAGHLLMRLHIERVLVLQAAHQPPARSGDPQRVHRQVLILGHPHRHRLEVLQERRTAQVPPARPDAALQPGLVPRPDLTQLDP